MTGGKGPFETVNGQYDFHSANEFRILFYYSNKIRAKCQYQQSSATKKCRLPVFALQYRTNTVILYIYLNNARTFVGYDVHLCLRGM